MLSSASAQSITGAGASGVTYSTTIKNLPYYTYEPKADITAQELSEVVKLLIPALTCRHYADDCGVADQIERSPPEIKRHFVRHED